MFSIQEQTAEKIFLTIIHYAVESGASDVHIEPLGNNSRIRFRIGKILNNSLILPIYFHNKLILHIKHLTGLNNQERRIPQNGRIKLYINDKIGVVNFSVSFLAVADGEKVVLSFLHSSFSFNKENEKNIINALREHKGIILISGSKKSGKKDVFYSILDKLSKEKSGDICTIEDSVDYFIDEVNQWEIKENIGFDFVSAFHLLLNSNPDIIGIKEIKNREIMDIAICSSDDCLVFFTFYADGAKDAIFRIKNMGIDPRRLLSNLKLIIDLDSENI